MAVRPSSRKRFNTDVIIAPEVPLFFVEEMAKSRKVLRQQRAHFFAGDSKILGLVLVNAETSGDCFHGGTVQRSLVFGGERQLEIPMDPLYNLDAVRDDFLV